MKTTVEEALKQLPDFEEFLSLAEEIRDLSLKKLLLEKEIKEKESYVFKVAVEDSNYFVNGKTPAISYISSAYVPMGLSGELVQPREKLAEIIAELDYKKLTMDIYKNMIEIYRTISANERGATF